MAALGAFVTKQQRSELKSAWERGKREGKEGKEAEDAVAVDMAEARRLFRIAADLDGTHHATWHAWAQAEWRVAGDCDAARALFQEGIWALPPSSPDCCRLFLSWALLESFEDENISLARELFHCAMKAQPRNAYVMEGWAKAEGRWGNAFRSAELAQMAVEVRGEVSGDFWPLGWHDAVLVPS